jgi:uncharacterized phiE125 gp8 family phage protein
MALRRTADAATEPITTAEAKAHLRVTTSTDDTLIDALVKAVRQMAENELRRSLITQTWTKTIDEFPDAIELPYPPVIAVASLKYYDKDAVQQTLDPSQYTVDSKSEPGWIVPAYGVSWPDTLAAINVVEVIYTAGFGAAVAVPQSVKNWILLHVGHLYENREATIPGVSITPLPFISALLDPYRVGTF